MVKGHEELLTLGDGAVVPHVIDARRYLSGVCWRWYPVAQVLYRFSIAISRAVANDGVLLVLLHILLSGLPAVFP